MTTISTAKLGELILEPFSPSDEAWWKGSSKDVNFWISCADRPSAEQIDFVFQIISDIEIVLKKARCFLVQSIMKSMDLNRSRRLIFPLASHSNDVRIIPQAEWQL
jgi:hypothetical protein